MSRSAGSTHFDSSKGIAPARTVGAMGFNDASDPSCRAEWGDTPGTLGVNDRAASITVGPQSFAPAVPGTEHLDPILVFRNQQIETTLIGESDKYFINGDLRWFFTYAHAQITRQINDNLKLFQRPNALMRLNIHFAETFINALWDQPHEDWRRAFAVCAAFQKTSQDTSFLFMEAEMCGARMANVHINIDLRKALGEVGCIPPEDYSNMLILVTRGSVYALVRLRGQLIGAAEALINAFVAPLVNLEIKTWRNAVYAGTCNADVPDPTMKLGL